MIDAAGFFDWAERDLGPPARMQWGQGWTAMDCITHHSLEGSYTPITGYTPFRDANRFPTAWHGTIKRDGVLWQHYPVFVRLQHGNSANTRGPGFESEGFAGEPLTPEQVKTWLRIHADIAAFTGKSYTRVPGSQVGLVEHREMTVPPGGTACPSGRYAPLWAALEDDMNESDTRALIASIVYGGTAVLDDLEKRGVAPLAARVNSLETVGDSVARTAIIKHEQAPHAGAGGEVPAHEHVPGPVAR